MRVIGNPTRTKAKSVFPTGGSQIFEIRVTRFHHNPAYFCQFFRCHFWRQLSLQFSIFSDPVSDAFGQRPKPLSIGSRSVAAV